MARIFISYKRADKEKVFNIKHQIESALGEKCWIDIDGIMSIVPFAIGTINAINECEVVLFMYSKEHSKITDLGRDWSARELHFASARKKSIIFVKIDGSTLIDAFEFDYGSSLQIDCSTAEGISRLIKHLSFILKSDQSFSSEKEVVTPSCVNKNEKFDVFISYSRKDIDIISPFLNTLESHHIKIWVDTSNIDYGDTFPDRIAEALDNSDSLLFMCTPNSLNAPYCKKEIGYARKQGKRIRAVLIDGKMPTKGWFALEYQDVNCVNLTDKHQEQSLLDELERKYNPDKADTQNIQQAKEENDELRYVDLGLSVKWATCNIGASKPWEYGRYFAWGDVNGQTWDGSRWSSGGFSSDSNYEVDANNNLKPEYDAARVNLGGNWRMPTKAEFDELIDNCTCIWTSNYNGTGIAGRIFTSKKAGYTDKSIFLPAAGYGRNSYLYDAGSYGSYWSGTFGRGSYAWYLYFSSDDVYTSGNNRYFGQSVRPVTE